ncbi:hypothetical protein Droror1_Dr00009745 [Drosera rotundifolia]
MTAILKVTKKHHKHLNNPFPSTPKSLPLIPGHLHFNPHTVPPHKTFPIGTDFHLLNGGAAAGGFLSISHRSQLKRSIWSTIPGQAFVSAAVAETEVEESRGSFAIKDRKVHLVCNHQTVEDVRVIDGFDDLISENNDVEIPYGKKDGFDLGDILGVDVVYPVVLVTGWIINVKRKKRKFKGSIREKSAITVDAARPPYAYAKYWLLFYQRNSDQVGFQVNFGKPRFEVANPKTAGVRASGIKVYPAHRLSRFQRIRPILSRSVGYVPLSTMEDEKAVEEQAKDADFNRVCLSYWSEAEERFYGFGEQFSHMDFKGKRVPILVQEQGIGRGDQPITLAINLVSYRAGGDWSTTYAPSPFYMTSKMRSLYLEGYNYSIFDLTREDRVHIQER